MNPELSRIITNQFRAQAVYFGVGLFLGVNPETGETQGLTLDQIASVCAWWRTVTVVGNDPEACRSRLANV